MSEYSYIEPMCDCHQDEVALVLCRHHKELLCLSCVLGREKSPECSIIEIRKVSEENDILMLECLVARQMTVKKKRLIDYHERKTETVKTNLEEQVIEMHSKLTKRLDEMKDTCLKSIETQAKAVIKTNKNNKQRIVIVETKVNEYLDKLSVSSPDDIICIQPNLIKMKTELVQNIPDKESMPEGHFKPNSFFGDFILQEDTSLGRVYLTDTEHYDMIDDLPENKVEMRSQETLPIQHLNKSEVSSKEEDKESVVTRQKLLAAVYTSSDEIVYGIKNETRIPAQSGENTGESTQADKKSLEEKKSGRIFGGLRRWFSSDIKRSDKSDGKEPERGINNLKTGSLCESKSRSTEHVYDVKTFAPSSYVHPKYLINKTVVLSKLEQQFSSACKFSKLVYLGDGFIGLLSKAHNSFVMADLLGNVYKTKTMIGGLEGAVATGKTEVALLVENGHQICKFDVSFVGFSTTEYFMVHEEIPNITGFDFDEASSQFAISSPNKLVILDKSGRKMKSVQYSSVQSPLTQMTTTYDFKRDCLYIMNMQNKTLKCFSFKTSDALWRCKYEDRSFIPRNMCLYKDTICIACRDEIALLLADDGSLAAKHDTKRLLCDCLGVYVIDDVIVFTSNSDDFKESTKLAYVSI
ncbi:uncharacterized protein LOC123564624 [Mercenaria mercenaria]|uniref:uncharacterized protein LOC123564624 n=1 Tax=Mercenaria mercenaria TaxID=6596 RepID=UPI00234EA3E3|nr:uncharacterized protein LOC123564624 [Mercenaria mercenaria]XP_045214274.2 uncharacterized protein LOC123564624 [Mercenaria mercenaria]XP_045214275.2 uncharacterized protein LOC123564624 [Mercenaria mercenaria]XP_053393277.1 uncharacterized protein LOC123564624 [Mercenaria mercenaria]